MSAVDAAELAAVTRYEIYGAPDRELTRGTFLIENVGYPLTTWLSIVADYDEAETIIIQIDLYADADCQVLIVDGIELDRFTQEQQLNIYHALHAKQCAASDRQAWMRRLEAIQRELGR